MPLNVDTGFAECLQKNDLEEATAGGTFVSAAGGTFVSAAGGTFETVMPGTFHSATGGTFETVLGGTINLLPSNQVVPLEYAVLSDIFLNLLSDSGLRFVFGHHFRIHAKSE